MAQVNLSDILQLSVAERIKLIEQIWDSIAANPDKLPITDAQRQELDRRYAEYKANPDQGRSWEEVRDSLKTDR